MIVIIIRIRIILTIFNNNFDNDNNINDNDNQNDINNNKNKIHKNNNDSDNHIIIYHNKNIINNKNDDKNDNDNDNSINDHNQASNNNNNNLRAYAMPPSYRRGCEQVICDRSWSEQAEAVTWRAADLSLLEQVQAKPVRGSTAAHLYVFYLSWGLWEAHVCGFYVSWRFREGTYSDDLWNRVGTLEKDLTRAGGGGGQGKGAADPPTSLMPDANMHAESLYFNFFGQSGVYSILYSMDFWGL